MIRLLLAIGSGLLLSLALPQAYPWLALREIDPAGHLGWLAWFALVPLLAALDRARGWKAALAVGLTGGMAYFYGAIWWVSHAMTAFGGLPLWLSLLALTLLVGYMAVHWGAALLLSWWIRRRLGWRWSLHLPAIWVAAEWLRNYSLTGFPWANLGYTQVRHLAVAQLAAAGGVYALAALVALVNAELAEALAARRGRGSPQWAALAATAALVGLVVLVGTMRLGWMRARMKAAPRLTVGLVQPNVNQALKIRGRDHAQYILGRLGPPTAEADRRGADLIAWPEAAHPYALPPEIGSFDQPELGVPRLSRAHLLVGAATYERRQSGGRQAAETSNSLFLLRPDLTVLGRYQKHHLVPFGEYVPLRGWLPFLDSVVPQLAPQRPGAELRVLSFPAPGGGEPVRVAPMICFDAIFPEVNVEYAERDPDLLVNPTNDAWYGYSSGPYQFLDIVRLRAVESGKAVARPAYAGVSALILPTGELVPGALPVGPVDPELAPDPAEPARLLVGQVPRLRGQTLYTRFGDLFAGLCSAWAGVAAALAWRARRT